MAGFFWPVDHKGLSLVHKDFEMGFESVLSVVWPKGDGVWDVIDNAQAVQIVHTLYER